MSRYAVALIAIFGGFGTLAVQHAAPAGASVCFDTARVVLNGHVIPASCTDIGTSSYTCQQSVSNKSRVWVGGIMWNEIWLQYSSYCRTVYTYISSAIPKGILFTRTTLDGVKAHFYEDTLSLPVYNSGYYDTRQLRDYNRRGFGCGWDGRSWICTGLY